LPADERVRVDLTAEDMEEVGFSRLGEYVRDGVGVMFSGYVVPEKPIYALAILPVLSSAIRIECYTEFAAGRWLVTAMRPLEAASPREEIQIQYAPKASLAQLLRRHKKRLGELTKEGWRALPAEPDLVSFVHRLAEAEGAFSA
jgi:hypothetical protein